jgi:tetratricopeptide (TPR) repeat protein
MAHSLLHWVITLLMLSACASRMVQVQSVPDQAEVSVLSDKGRTVIGKTPLTINAEDQPQLFSTGGMIELRINGFFPEVLVLPGSELGKSTNLSVKLSELKAADSCSHATASALARGVAMAQQQILSKRYLEAETTLKNLVVSYPNLSVIHDLLGNLYYLQRDTGRSLQAYQRSYELEPGNTFTERMIRKLSSFSPTDAGPSDSTRR